MLAIKIQGAFFGACAPKNQAFRSNSSERSAFLRDFRFNPLRICSFAWIAKNALKSELLLIPNFSFIIAHLFAILNE
jgi:hypothetical protein